ncbi:STAS domain-containing protein [Streptomyces scabiei]|uniref:STAS domain-containing protein n=1 Tax=Streptomyces scabiei TaxID=1930 RepID=UPI00368F5F9F
MTAIENADRPGRLSFAHHVVDDIRVVTLRGEIDHDVKDLFEEALLTGGVGAPPPRIVVDLGGVTFMDSSGINVLVAAHRRVSGEKGWLRIAAAQESVLRVLQLVGVDTFIPCHPTVEQALSG